MSAETPTHRAPVIGGAEKSVQDDKRIAVSYNFKRQTHISKADRLSLRLSLKLEYHPLRMNE
jgi:hypothetical protein